MHKYSAPHVPDEDLLFAGQSVFKHKSAALLSIPQLRRLSPDDRVCLQTEGNYYLLFLLEGRAELRLNTQYPTTLTEAGEMVFVPMGSVVEITATEPLEYLTFHFLPSVHLCARQCPERPVQHFSSAAVKAVEPYLTRLPFSPGITYWTRSITEYLQYSLSDLRLFDVKLQELFLLLRMNYARRMQEEFLRFFHCRRVGFSCQVFKHHLNCRTVDDLAMAMGVSPSALARLFDDEFGIPPMKWLLQQRARHVYKDLIDSDLSLTEIAERYYFSSAGYLSAFCRRVFGLSPIKIRRGDLSSVGGEGIEPEGEEGEGLEETKEA